MAQLLETEEVLRNHIAWKTPADEVAGIVRLVRRQLQGNAQMTMDGVYVAVPNKVWLSAFSQALGAARITCFSPKQLANAMSSTEEMPLEDFGGSVCLGSYGSIAAVAPVHLFATGLVEGFYPVGTEDEAVLAREAAVLNGALETVPGTLILSSFKRVSPDEAAEWRLPVARRRKEHGRDVVIVTHSCFIDRMYDAAPALVSGEQFISNLFGI